MGYKIAVAGATGMVGREMLATLAEREFPADEVTAIATSASTGQDADYGESGRVLKVRNIEHVDFSALDMCLLAMPASAAKTWAPKIAAAGCAAIDVSPEFRLEPGVPLIAPEVNPEAIDGYAKKRIIACPGALSAQLLVALKPLHDLGKVKRVVCSSYQSVSGAGREAMDELFEQTRGILVGDMPEAKRLPKQIAFNLIPQIDLFMADGATQEEWRLKSEVMKALSPDVEVAATCVRVPVFVGHALAVHAEFERPVSEKEARRILREAPGCMLVDTREPGGYATPAETVGEYATYISRLRADPTVKHGLAFWVVADNLRKGAALNAVQVAELLGRRLLKKAS